MEEAEIGEVGVDKINDQAHEKAREEKGRAPWLRWLALSTALFAVVAAVASLKSGSNANEALLDEARATDQWAYYQSKGNKAVTREAEADVLSAMTPPAAAALIEKVKEESERYRKEQEPLQEEAKKLEVDARNHLAHHERFAYIVTTLQVSIGLSAVAALVERRALWFVALVAGALGTFLFVVSFFGF